MRKRIVIIVIVLAAGAAAAWFWTHRHKKDDNAIRISGNIEVTEVDLSFRVPGRVVERPVDEGMQIQPGTLIARLDTSTFQHEVDVNQAALEAARSQLLELEHGSRPEEIRTARAALAAAQADADRWRKEHARQAVLVSEGILSKEAFDTTVAAWKTSQQKVQQAAEMLALAEKGPRQETIEQARARVEQASAALAGARNNLSFTTLTSPSSGTVTAKHTESGEQVAAGTPIVTIADLRNIWMRGYIDETDLGRVHLGQKVRVTTDTYPGKVYDGTITFISPEAEFTPKTVQTEKERVKLVYRIKVTIDNRSLELKPGMPADGEIAVGRSEQRAASGEQRGAPPQPLAKSSHSPRERAIYAKRTSRAELGEGRPEYALRQIRPPHPTRRQGLSQRHSPSPAGRGTISRGPGRYSPLAVLLAARCEASGS